MGADLLSIGKSGLFASKKSLETTGHNISNANTEGYSRQRVNQHANRPLGHGKMVEGTGVRIEGIRRVHDQHIEKRLGKAVSGHEYNTSRFGKLDQMQEVFNEINGEGFNQVLNQFFNAFKELSNQPESETIRSVVRETAKRIVKDIRLIRDRLNDIESQIDSELTRHTETINSLSEKIAKLNVKIAEIEAIEGETGDLRDQRDLTIKHLAEFFELNTYTDERNRFVVNGVGVGSIVSGGFVQKFKAAPSPLTMSSNNHEGSVEVFWQNRPNSPVTHRFSKGSFSSLIKSRNVELKALQERVDDVAYNLIQSVNAVHRKGFANKKLMVNQNGEPYPTERDLPVTGINFFKEPTGKQFAAEQIDLSAEVKEDLRNVATALQPNSPGDNRVSIAISKLQHEKMLGEGTKTIEEHYLEAIGQIGLVAGKTRVNMEQSEGILTQVNSIKERISGVSLDEEAANLVKYQQAYNAAAKVMKTADETFDAILSIGN